jgi:hypothetical protein
MVEGLGSKLVLTLFHITVTVGLIIIGRMELEGKKNL